MHEENEAAWDRVLRDAVLAGDESAWRVLYERSFDSLQAFVGRRTGTDRHLAEDVLQETWMVAVRRLKTFDPTRGAFEGWLVGIALNVLRNRWRRREARRSTTQAAPSPSAQDPVRDVTAAEHIQLAMAGLPVSYREVLRAKYEEQLSIAEIANRHQKSVKSVESLLTRARKAFQGVYRRLEAKGAGPREPGGAS